MFHRTNVLVLAAAMSLGLACKKSPSTGSGSATEPGSGAGSGSGSPIGAGSATGSAAPAAPGPSAAPAPAPSPGSGSAAGSGSGGGSAAGAVDATAFQDSPLCRQVIDKIRACYARPEFIQKLDEGATREQKKINAKLRKEIKKWPDADELCGNQFSMFTYEYRGFLDNPAPLSSPSALSSCGELAAAVKAAGGLVGGERAI